MPNDFMASTTEAATKLYEANRDASVAIWSAGVEGQERFIKLAKTWIDEAQSQSVVDTGLVDTISDHVRKGQQAGQELAQSYFAAGLATMYFPFAVVDQVIRPVVKQ